MRTSQQQSYWRQHREGKKPKPSAREFEDYWTRFAHFTDHAGHSAGIGSSFDDPMAQRDLCYRGLKHGTGRITPGYMFEDRAHDRSFRDPYEISVSSKSYKAKPAAAFEGARLRHKLITAGVLPDKRTPDAMTTQEIKMDMLADGFIALSPKRRLAPRSRWRGAWVSVAVYASGSGLRLVISRGLARKLAWGRSPHVRIEVGVGREHGIIRLIPDARGFPVRRSKNSLFLHFSGSIDLAPREPQRVDHRIFGDMLILALPPDWTDKPSQWDASLARQNE